MAEAFQMRTMSRHPYRHAPLTATSGGCTLKPHGTLLFAGYMSTQKRQEFRQQKQKPKLLHRLEAKSDVSGGKSEKGSTTLAGRVRKFIMAIFRILLAPLRLFRSSSPKVEPDVATLVPELVVDEAIPEKVVEIAVDVATQEEEEASAPLPIEFLEEEAPLPTQVLEEEAPNPIKVLEQEAPLPVKLLEEEAPPVSPVTDATPAKVVTTATSTARPAGDRWATATVDLSGDWVIIVSDEFKEQYDEYLKQLGQPIIVRGIALGIIGLTSEYTEQTDQGRSLFIRGINARGVWERSLIASGADERNATFEPIERTVVTADDEKVKAEAWWEEGGTVHMSWMRGVTKYGGGDFESKRYLEQDGKVLVCESIFFPQDEKREKARVTWRFLRKGATL